LENRKISNPYQESNFLFPGHSAYDLATIPNDLHQYWTLITGSLIYLIFTVWPLNPNVAAESRCHLCFKRPCLHGLGTALSFPSVKSCFGTRAPQLA